LVQANSEFGGAAGIIMNSPFADSPDSSFWAGSAVIGAVIAALGFVGKQVADLLLSLWRERKLQRAQLIELRSLLRAARATFLTQLKLAERLYSSLGENHSTERLSGGYRVNASYLA
jgi:hypothetical protein